MTKKVLFLSNRDIRERHELTGRALDTHRNLGANSGNLAFTSGMQRYLDAGPYDYDVKYFSTVEGIKDVDWNQYDKCVLNVSNWLALFGKATLEQVVATFKGVRVPTYMVGLGAQAELHSGPEFLTPIKDVAQSFIRTILDTGGAFGLRGEFTARCFDWLGFPSGYTVVGCPSLYQTGENLSIGSERVSREEFSIVGNGAAELRSASFMSALTSSSKNAFMDQDTLMRAIFFFDELTPAGRASLLSQSEPTLRALKTGQIRIFANLDDWSGYLTEAGFSFSYGSRVHGNFIALLNGIPAMINVVDSRTEELANFFAVPSTQGRNIKSEDELYQLYLSADYTPFNATFKERWSNFWRFVETHDLPLAPPQSSMMDRSTGIPDKQETSSNLIELIDDYLEFKGPGILDRRKEYLLHRKLTGKSV